MFDSSSPTPTVNRVRPCMAALAANSDTTEAAPAGSLPHCDTVPAANRLAAPTSSGRGSNERQTASRISSVVPSVRSSMLPMLREIPGPGRYTRVPAPVSPSGGRGSDPSPSRRTEEQR